jgi:brefeldin A-inhibited guanine nucleotide-exchange protein
MDFKGMNLDDAIRKFLSYFDLPGEGQKIDRIMQAFAGKFYEDNPQTYFKSASAAYTMSFLLIMLQSDAHNPQIKEQDRMKLPSFIKTARGINDGENLTEEELVGFYTRVCKAPLAMKDADRAKRNIADSQNQSLKMKQQQFELESAKMIQQSQEFFKQKYDAQYYTVTGTEYIKALFNEIIWSPVIAVLSILLEQSDDPKIQQLCLEGFANCIKLTGYHNMNTERDTFISGLAKFTNLTSLR